jgi:DNA invertase Pin-like site-specific DNA recombinase
LSIEAQSEQVKRAAIYLTGSEAEIFVEPDISGSTEFLKRPQGFALWVRAKEAAVLGHSVSIIVPKVDRLGRDVIDISQTVKRFEALNARILFLDINVDTRTAMGRAFMQIAAVFAELELARIRERIQTALDQKRTNGLLTGTVPFGWDAVETGAITAKGVKVRELVDNPDEQRWILHMVVRREGGWSYQQIANELNCSGVPTKRSGAILKLRDTGDKSSVRQACGRWQAGNVAKILANKSVQRWLLTQK